MIPAEKPMQAGIFASNGNGCLTILRVGRSNSHVAISFTPNDETSTADLEVQNMVVPAALFDEALELAGYAAAPKGRRIKA